MADKAPALSLTTSIINRSDVGRLLREIASLDATMHKKTPQKDKLLPTSPLLNDLSEQNKLNLLQSSDREILKTFLEAVREKSPVLHFSFSVNPAPRFLERLIVWLRREIDPNVLIQIGLEPTIGAGCVLRTTNRFFDFSLRNYFANQNELLITKLKESLK
jgi:F0F1-type ATP synthase delta subunit